MNRSLNRFPSGWESVSDIVVFQGALLRSARMRAASALIVRAASHPRCLASLARSVCSALSTDLDLPQTLCQILTQLNLHPLLPNLPLSNLLPSLMTQPLLLLPCDLCLCLFVPHLCEPCLCLFFDLENGRCA
jgi:hypothetical protein